MQKLRGLMRTYANIFISRFGFGFCGLQKNLSLMFFLNRHHKYYYVDINYVDINSS